MKVIRLTLLLGALVARFPVLGQQPSILTQPSDQTVAVGSTAIFEAEAAGALPLAYQWRAYQSYSTFTNIPLATNHWLILSNVTPTFHRFGIVAQNSEGSVTSQLARLIVLEPVSVSEIQSSTSIFLTGSSLTLWVQASGAVPLAYQWFFNDQPLAGRTSASLALSNLQLENSGNYSVTVSNPVSQITRTRRVDVISPVEIITQPSSQTVFEGETVTFVVEVNYTEPLQYQWFLNNSPLSGRTESVLVLEGVGVAQRGTYQVRILSSLGITWSAPAQLEVLGPPHVTFSPPSRAEPTGGTTTFTVGILGTPPLQFQWWFEETPLNGQTNQNLSLTNLQATANGYYQLIVTNIYGQAMTVPALLEVLDPPSILDGPSGQSVFLGETATFTVTASGAETLIYRWYTPRGGEFLIASNTFTVTNVEWEDAGPYLVEVQNRVGTITSAPAILTVNPEPAGALDAQFPAGQGPDNVVRATATDGQGRIYIGGAFEHVDGLVRRGIARLNADGTLDPSFDAGTTFGWQIYALALTADSKVLVGGNISGLEANGPTQVARLTETGAVDPTFQVGTGINGWVWAILPESNGSVLLGGDFSEINGLVRHGLVRVTETGTVVSEFTPNLNSGARIRAMAKTSEDKILVAGNFQTVDETNRNSLARLEPNGQLDLAYQPSLETGAWVFEILPTEDDGVYVGGNFLSVEGSQRHGIARLGAEGHLDPVFDAGQGTAGGTVTALARQADGRLLIGGGFSTFNGVARQNLVRVYPDGAIDPLFRAEANNWIESIQIEPSPSDTLLMAGAFSRVNGQVRPYVARLRYEDPAPFAPVITRQPGNKNVIEGSDVEWSVHAFGFPRLSFQWFVDTQPIPGATGATLRLRNVNLSQQGHYSVVVSNEQGRATSESVSLTVQPAPTGVGSADLAFYTGTGPNGMVQALAVQADRKVVIGGLFGQVDGLALPQVARLNEDGSADESFRMRAAYQGHIYDIEIQENGQILVAGLIRFADEGFFRTLTRLNPDGSMEPVATFHPNLNGFVLAMALQEDGRIVIGGSFQTPEPNPTYYLARLMEDGSLDTSFGTGLGVNGVVAAVLPQDDGHILIGGAFTSVHGRPQSRLARLNDDGSLDPAFDIGSGPNGRITSILELPDGRLLVAGEFLRFNGQPRAGLARLHPHGSLDETFQTGSGQDGLIKAILLQDNGKIMVGGLFNEWNGLPYQGIARLNPDGGLDPTFDSIQGPNYVYAIARRNAEDLLIGGDFFQIKGVPRPRVAVLRAGEANPAAPTLVAPPQDQNVRAGANVTFTVTASAMPSPAYQWLFNGFELTDSTRWLYRLRNVQSHDQGSYSVMVENSLGGFTSPAASLEVQPAVFYAGAADINFYTGWGPNDRVQAIVIQPDDRIIIGGAFNEVDGVRRPRLARLHPDGRLDESFDPGTGPNGTIEALAWRSDGRLLIAGNFTEVNGTPRNRVAALHEDGTVDTSFDPGVGPNGEINSMMVGADDTVVIAGYFNLVQGAVRNRIARLEKSGLLDLNFYPGQGPNGAISALALPRDGGVIAVGYFSQFDGQVANRIVRLTETGAVDLGFMAPSSLFYSALSAVVDGDNRIVVGGIDPNQRGLIARLTPSGALDTSFQAAQTNPFGIVTTLAVQSDGKVLGGGSFGILNQSVQSRITRLRNDGRVDLEFNSGIGITGGLVMDEYGEVIDQTRVETLAIERNGHILVGGEFLEANGVARPFLARLFGEDASHLILFRTFQDAEGLKLELSWPYGTLQQADGVTGPWEDSSVASPYVISPADQQKFYRLRLN